MYFGRKFVFVCAAPSYLDAAPRLGTSRDLERHNCIVLRENNADHALWRFGEKEQERCKRLLLRTGSDVY